MSLLIHNAEEIIQVSNNLQMFKTGDDMNDIAKLERTTLEGLSIAIDRDGKIAMIGSDSSVQSAYKDTIWDRKIDASGKSIIPGLVDAHTHPVWAGDRVHEFTMKLAGASYLDVHKAGGGINFTVTKTKEASEDQLLESFLERATKMSKAGTTFVECKSGYGLDLETELKMLKTLEKARSKVNLGISSTYCGAHAVPRDSTAAEATQNIIEVQLPAIKKLVEEGQLTVDSVDAFCEKNIFEVEDTKKIMEKAREFGFMINFHAEELNYLGGVEMGSSLNAEAMSHLEEISDEGISAMAKAGSVAVLLPTTAFLLRLRQPPARKLIEANVPVALGSDFNPNAHCLSMPLVMHLACVQMYLSLNEALVAATLNSAHSVRKSNEIGSIENGKWADILILNTTKWEHLVYQLGGHQDLISHVIHHGKVVHEQN